MFADKTFGGKPFDKAYAEARQKWEPVAEITQTKGDSETDPSVSPDDEFANFERWDKTNIAGTQDDTPEQQLHNYLRPALTRGLKFEQELGANPYKYGLIGSSDNHTALSMVAADNFFGALPDAEPGPSRLTHAPLLVTKGAQAAAADLGNGVVGLRRRLGDGQYA